MSKEKSSKNKTLQILHEERDFLKSRVCKIDTNRSELSIDDLINKTFNNDLFEVLNLLPEKVFDLIIVDPPYNLSKNFHGLKFDKMNEDEYIEYLESWLPKVVKLLKDNGSIYVCCDWKSSNAIYQVLSKYTIIRNRITWEREKGRGSQKNWKNCSEDIWFATISDDYYFNVDAVKIKKKVIAPYRENGKPKDWFIDENGEEYRLTHPSNIWTDITIPYWSMPENTEHPTQKPEKLIAKLILASSKENDLIFDPFLGSGTTSVVAKKLNRKYSGIEINEEYCLWTEKRLLQAETNKNIQGYYNGIFYERNSIPSISKEKTKNGNKIELI